MYINNVSFNKVCLYMLGHIVSVEELVSRVNNIIREIEKNNVLDYKKRKITIETLLKIVAIIVNNQKLNINKEILKITVDILKEINKLKTDNFYDGAMIEGIAEYIKLCIDNSYIR